MENSSNPDLTKTSKSNVTDTTNPGAATSNSTLQTKTADEVPPNSDLTVNNVVKSEKADAAPVSSKLDATVKTEKAEAKDDAVSVSSQLPSTPNTIGKPCIRFQVFVAIHSAIT